MLGQVSQHVSVIDKVKGAYAIREAFSTAARLDPYDAEAEHCLGRWCLSIAELGASNWVARTAMRSIGLSASFEEALEHFRAAEVLEARANGHVSGHTRPANDLMIGKCLHAMGESTQATIHLTKAGEPVDAAAAASELTIDDLEARQEALKLLVTLTASAGTARSAAR